MKGEHQAVASMRAYQDEHEFGVSSKQMNADVEETYCVAHVSQPELAFSVVRLCLCAIERHMAGQRCSSTPS